MERERERRDKYIYSVRSGIELGDGTAPAGMRGAGQVDGASLVREDHPVLLQRLNDRQRLACVEVNARVCNYERE
jgi:hypothetical protein